MIDAFVLGVELGCVIDGTYVQT